MKLYNLNLSNSWFSLLLFFSMPAIGCKSNRTSNVITKDLELRDGKEQANRHILLGGKEFAQISEVGSANGNVGINQPNPQYSLDVNGTGSFNAALILSKVSASFNFGSDAAAAAGGVPLGGLYRNGNAIQIRIT